MLLAVAALALRHGDAAIPAVIGAGAGLCSVMVARRRDEDLGHTFVVLDWLLLGCTLVFSGGADSWLLGALPLLAMGHLAGAPRREWPYLLAPSLLLLVVLAIADPSLGGNRLGGVAKVLVLAVGGWVAATRLPRAGAQRPQRAPVQRPRGAVQRPRQRAARVDGTTGLYTGERLRDLLCAGMEAALAEHRPLSVVYLRLEQYEDCRNFLGPQGSEQLVRAVAHRVERHLGPDDRAFRVAPDAFVMTLLGSSLAEAHERAASVAHDVGGNLIAGRRQTLASGASSFPTVRRLDDLLSAAREDSEELEDRREPVPTVVRLAAAQ